MFRIVFVLLFVNCQVRRLSVMVVSFVLISVMICVVKRWWKVGFFKVESIMFLMLVVFGFSYMELESFFFVCCC